MFQILHEESWKRGHEEAIVKDLSVTKRNHSAIETIDNGLNMFVEEPITDWGATLNSAGLPIMNRSIGAFVGLILTLIMRNVNCKT